MPLQLDNAIRDINQALTLPDAPWDAAEIADARRAIDRILARRAIVGPHVVAALVGGTGSGKSSLFNALTDTDLADAGALRPTTEVASAFAWGQITDSLVDYLELDRERVTARRAFLERAHEAALENLVLLDLPDHDSVRDEHSGLVDKLLPVVDVLIWVVDPQKYADHILHSRYLAKMRRRADSMLVVLNHVDRVPAGRREILIEDIHELLQRDGLPDVPVYTTSATTGEGINQLRRQLAEINALPSLAERTARAELDVVVEKLRAKVGHHEGEINEALVQETSKELAEACGLDAITQALEHAIMRPRDASVPTSAAPSYPTVAAVGSTWRLHAQAGLPEVWVDRIDEVTPAVGDLANRVHEAVNNVELPSLKDPLGTPLRIGGYALIALTVLCFILAFVLGPRAAWLLGAVVSFAAGIALVGLATWRMRRMAASAPKVYRDQAIAAVEAVVRQDLVDPTVQVLAKNEEIGALLH
ncbi:MAG: 50S ribosome-binding GTPase [Bowdeniella nasicola]|nr:50S ribosome-binding GTPase [Bowdeniella nasicola]